MTNGKNNVVLNCPAAKLRRIALAKQGLHNTKGLSSSSSSSSGSGKTGVAAAVAHLGYVQIDTISVVERAHHHVLWTRVRNYQPQDLDAAVRDKTIFEYWFHAAAYLPINDYRFALPRMNAIKSGEKHWFDNIDKKLLKSVYQRIKTEGPLRARDFADTATSSTGWWDWKPAKQAIEKLFMQGDLMIVGREGFQKRYDLTERVLPAHVCTSTPDHNEEAKHLIDTTLRAHGFASLKSFTYLRKGKELRQSVRDCIEAYIDCGRVVRIKSQKGEDFYADAECLEGSRRAGSAVRLLSPFDNLVIQRERCRDIFNFNYQIECYVPAAKRKYGYFCLPILYKDTLVGRIDCKADRKARILQIKYLQYEVTDEEFLTSLADELIRFKRFNNCQTIDVIKTEKASSAKKLRQLLI